MKNSIQSGIQSGEALLSTFIIYSLPRSEHASEHNSGRINFHEHFTSNESQSFRASRPALSFRRLPGLCAKRAGSVEG
jgi:hypothetical protein